MPNTADTINAFFSIFQSGVIASGSDKITVAKTLLSGDAMTSFRQSGKLELVQFSLGRASEIIPLTGSIFVGRVVDHVVEDIFVHGTYQDSGVALSGLRRLVDDSKITVASGLWQSGSAGTFNLPSPKLEGERWPIPHEKFAHAQLMWRVQYVL